MSLYLLFSSIDSHRDRPSDVQFNRALAECFYKNLFIKGPLAYITKFVGSFKNQQWKAKMFCLVSSSNEKHRLLPIDRKKLRPCTMEPVFLIFWFWYVGILSLCKQVTIFHKDIYVFSIHSFWEFLLTSYFRMWSIFKSPLKHDNYVRSCQLGFQNRTI